MTIDVIIHHGGTMQHNLGLGYIGGLTDEIKDYDIDFLSEWKIEDVVRDLGYVNDLRYWYKLDDNDMDKDNDTSLGQSQADMWHKRSSFFILNLTFLLF